LRFGSLQGPVPLIFQDLITENDLIDHPDRLYLFDDNEIRRGRGGQAGVCRGHPNVVSVATKRSPDCTLHAYWNDVEFDCFIASIAHDLTPAMLHILKGGTAVCPTRGLGTGLSGAASKDGAVTESEHPAHPTPDVMSFAGRFRLPQSQDGPTWPNRTGRLSNLSCCC